MTQTPAGCTSHAHNTQGPVDAKKCVKERNVRALRNRETVHLPNHIPADEFTLAQDFAKNDPLGQGTVNNAKVCPKEPRLCVVDILNRLRRLNSQWLHDERHADRFLLTLASGAVLKKEAVVKTLRAAAIRRGLDPSILSSHSLRAGGCTALWVARKNEALCQRRGRWVSNCWKLYTWPTRSEDDDVANDMATAQSDLFAHLR